MNSGIVSINYETTNFILSRCRKAFARDFGENLFDEFSKKDVFPTQQDVVEILRKSLPQEIFDKMVIVTDRKQYNEILRREGVPLEIAAKQTDTYGQCSIAEIYKGKCLYFLNMQDIYNEHYTYIRDDMRKKLFFVKNLHRLQHTNCSIY